MKKKLDEAAMVNELRGASVFFRRPSDTPGSRPAPEVTELQRPSTSPESDASQEAQPEAVPAAQQTRLQGEEQPHVPRRIKPRHPFDIYFDQLETLQRLSAEERMHGGLGSMSKMVREALDAYFTARRGEEQTRTGSTVLVEEDNLP